MLVEPAINRRRKRGLYHRDYAGATLRENLGLRKPQAGSRPWLKR